MSNASASAHPIYPIRPSTGEKSNYMIETTPIVPATPALRAGDNVALREDDRDANVTAIRDEKAALRSVARRLANAVSQLVEDGSEDSLISQVRQAKANSTGAGGGGGSLANTRVPINVSAIDLYRELSAAGNLALTAMSGNPIRRPVEPDIALATWARWAVDEIGHDRVDEDTANAWVKQTNYLVARCRELLTPMRRTEIVGRACPACGALRSPRGAWTLSSPRIEGVLRVECGTCHEKWVGQDEVELAFAA